MARVQSLVVHPTAKRSATKDSRLIHLNLPTLKYRRLRGDMIEVYKIIHNIYDSRASPYLPLNSLNSRANTRGNDYKLLNFSFHYDLRKHFFTARIVNPLMHSVPHMGHSNKLSRKSPLVVE